MRTVIIFLLLLLLVGSVASASVRILFLQPPSSACETGEPVWSYGKSKVNDSCLDSITPTWSYGESKIIAQ